MPEKLSKIPAFSLASPQIRSSLPSSLRSDAHPVTFAHRHSFSLTGRHPFSLIQEVLGSDSEVYDISEVKLEIKIKRMIELRVEEMAVEEWSEQDSFAADLQRAFRDDAWRNIIPGLRRVEMYLEACECRCFRQHSCC